MRVDRGCTSMLLFTNLINIPQIRLPKVHAFILSRIVSITKAHITDQHNVSLHRGKEEGTSRRGKKPLYYYLIDLFIRHGSAFGHLRHGAFCKVTNSAA